MSLLPAKLKRARELLDLSQTQAAIDSQVKQPHLSDMEKNDKGLIPKRYIDFLFSRGIDLNSLFDDRVEVRLRPEEPHVPGMPIVDAIRDVGAHVQAVAGAPEWLKPLQAMQQELAKVQAELARLKEAEKGKGKKAG